jgi:hypothetical protein
MKIPYAPMVRHPLLHHQATHKLSRNWSGNRGGKKIDPKLKKFADRFGAKNLAQGLTNHLSHFATEALNQQLDQSPLPKFLQDELRSVTKEQCSKSLSGDFKACQTECDLLVEDCAALIEQSINDEVCETCVGLTSPANDNASIKNSNQQASLALLLNSIYEMLIFQTAQVVIKSDTDAKLTNWLVALSGTIAGLQTHFVSAAMENLKSMNEHTNFTTYDQTTLDAMKECERSEYQLKYSKSRKRFTLARNHFKANLRLFRLSTHMLTGTFNVLRRPDLLDD